MFAAIGELGYTCIAMNIHNYYGFVSVIVRLLITRGTRG